MSVAIYDHPLNNFITILMFVLNSWKSSQVCQKRSTCDLLKKAFQSQKMQQISSNQVGDRKRISFKANLLLPKVKNLIGVHWDCKVTQSIIFINLKLDSTCPTSFKFCQFLRNHQKIQQFVHLINNLSLCDSEGYFCFRQETGELILRYKLTNFMFLSSQTVVHKYFIRCIKRASKIFLEQIEQIIFYYRLPGISLSQAQMFFQHQNQVPLLQQTETLIFLRNSFEADRQKRANSSKQIIKWNDQNPISSVVCLLTHSQEKVSNNKQDEAKFERYSNIFRYEIETILKDISHRKKAETTQIVTGFKIREVLNETQVGFGGFSYIFFGTYHYFLQISIYNDSQPSFLHQQQKIVKNGLIKKVSNAVKVEDNISIQNQCNFLIHMRNKVCPYIAQYFCKVQISKEPFSDKQIYAEYYPDNLGNSRQKGNQKMKIMQDVCMALLFMHQEKLLHRDLKQTNIMIDRYHRGKLIDFGSVANMKGSSNFKQKDNIVRSTQGYYKAYLQALTEVPSLRNFMSKDQYYCHETYDLYSLGVILDNQFYLSEFTSQDHFIRNNLKYLSDKCKETNPNDRWTIQQVTIFLRHLIIFYQLRRQFWNWGFDKRFKAHELGAYYNGNGAYNLRVKKQVFASQTRQQL